MQFDTDVTLADAGGRTASISRDEALRTARAAYAAFFVDATDTLVDLGVYTSGLVPGRLVRAVRVVEPQGRAGITVPVCPSVPAATSGAQPSGPAG